jgi:hypothetical protein
LQAQTRDRRRARTDNRKFQCNTAHLGESIAQSGRHLFLAGVSWWIHRREQPKRRVHSDGLYLPALSQAQATLAHGGGIQQTTETLESVLRRQVDFVE